MVPGGPSRGPGWQDAGWKKEASLPGGGWGAAHAPSIRPAPHTHSVMSVVESGEAKETLVPKRLFHFPMMPGGRARVWEVCLPASSSSSSPNSRNKQGRLQLRREGEQAGGPSWGRRGGGDWSGRQDPDGARDTHTRARLGTDAPTLTHSHTLGLVPAHRPPCGDTKTPSANSANPQNTPWTHTEIQAFTPPIPHTHRVGSRQQLEGGEENGGRKDSRRQKGCAAKALGARVSLPHSFPKTQ